MPNPVPLNDFPRWSPGNLGRLYWPGTGPCRYRPRPKRKMLGRVAGVGWVVGISPLDQVAVAELLEARRFGEVKKVPFVGGAMKYLNVPGILIQRSIG